MLNNIVETMMNNIVGLTIVLLPHDTNVVKALFRQQLVTFLHRQQPLMSTGNATVTRHSLAVRHFGTGCRLVVTPSLKSFFSPSRQVQTVVILERHTIVVV